MTQDEIIEMVREAGGSDVGGPGWTTWVGTQSTEFLERFAKLAAAKAIAELESQEPVAHLWECLGRWSAYLVDNGAQADCAPPQWLVDAIKNATAPPQRTWVGLTNDELDEWTPEIHDVIRAIEAKLKEKNT
jgi:hypothetical protein